MDIRKLEGGVSFARQINAADISALKSLGIRAIVCNRPDGDTDTAFGILLRECTPLPIYWRETLKGHERIAKHEKPTVNARDAVGKANR